MPDQAQAGEYVELLHESELWDGEMEAYDVGAAEVLVVKVDGQICAFDGICPHQSQSLVEGDLEDGVLTCAAHEWQFDVRSGESVNPRGERLIRHDVAVDDDGTVRVRLSGRMAARSR
jgi:nitrite reductase/ring-hydroxylating ferredoxin subunit